MCVPGRSGHKVSIQQAQLAEEDSVDKGDSGQLLQRQMGLELEFLLFHEEGHGCDVFTRIKHRLRLTNECGKGEKHY